MILLATGHGSTRRQPTGSCVRDRTRIIIRPCQRNASGSPITSAGTCWGSASPSRQRLGAAVRRPSRAAVAHDRSRASYADSSRPGPSAQCTSMSAPITGSDPSSYVSDLLIFVFHPLPLDRGWFSREDQRMHLQTVESAARSAPNTAKAWLENRGRHPPPPRLLQAIGNSLSIDR
jgi:hypothetical protein